MSTRHVSFIATFLAALAIALAGVPAHAAQTAAKRQPARHFHLVNASFDSVTALTIAPAGSDAFHDIALGRPLQGGLSSMDFRVPAGDCMRDVRVTFRNGRSLLYPHIDMCRYHGLRLQPGARGPASAVAVASSSRP